MLRLRSLIADSLDMAYHLRAAIARKDREMTKGFAQANVKNLEETAKLVERMMRSGQIGIVAPLSKESGAAISEAPIVCSSRTFAVKNEDENVHKKERHGK